MSKYNLWYVLDENKKPVPATAEDFEYFMANSNGRIVGYDVVNNLRVSTVFLGLDHRFTRTDGSEPIVFETMVFPGDEWLEVYCDRYTSWDAARAGHEAVVQRVKDGETFTREDDDA